MSQPLDLGRRARHALCLPPLGHGAVGRAEAGVRARAVGGPVMGYTMDADMHEPHYKDKLTATNILGTMHGNYNR